MSQSPERPLADPSIYKIPSDKLKSRYENYDKRISFGAFKPYIRPEIRQFFSKEGENCIRILAPLEKEVLGHYGMDIAYHPKIGINEDNFICLKRTFKEKCFICLKQTSKLWEENKELAKSFFPFDKILMWVIDLKATEKEIEENGNVLLYACPPTLEREILLQSHKKGTEVYIDLSHPQEGRPVWFTRVGKTQKDTKYSGVQLDENVSPVLLEEYESLIKPFVDCIIIPTYNEVKEADESIFCSDEIIKSPGKEIRQEDLGKSEQDFEGFANRSQVLKETQIRQEYDCYGKEYGKYRDCVRCTHNTACQELQNYPAPKELPSRTIRQNIKEEQNPVESSVKDKLTKAIEARRIRPEPTPF